jgi:preprotein translocase subunit SecA
MLTRRKTSAKKSQPQLRPADRTFVEQVRTLEQVVAGLPDSALRARADVLRDRCIGRDRIANEESLVQAFALVSESIRRSLGVTPFDVQILAGAALVRGEVAEMQTGEGKTITAAFPVFTMSLFERGVHMVTSNSYLSQRDRDELAPVYERLGASVGLISSDRTIDEKRTAYACDITYGPGYEFGFDYLRDQIAIREQPVTRLGDDFLSVLRGKTKSRRRTMQRNLKFAVIDEVDNVLIDDGNSPLLLCGPSAGDAPDADLHLAARDLAARMVENTDFVMRAGQIQWTDLGHAAIWEDRDQLPLKQLVRPWLSYVEQAVRAQSFYRRDVHYVVREKKVCIVDESTGRIFAERSWRDGLHQAIEAAESVPITAENQPLARITRQRFYRQYANLAGMTGTAQGSEREFSLFYGLPVSVIPTRLPSQRSIQPTRFFADADSKWIAVAKETYKRHQVGQPVLMGTRSIARSELISNHLEQLGIPHQLLNGIQDADEAQIVANAGQVGMVTIATNMAGRGTDIKPDKAAFDRGGLHVIATEFHDDSRIDRQLLGRSARQGNPGSAQMFVSADDELFVRHSSSIRSVMSRASTQNGEITADLTRPVRKVQQQVERQQFLQRRQLFYQDRHRDTVMAKLMGVQS